MTPNDETLMEAVAKGELSQLAELYRRYRDPIYGFLFNRNGGDGPRAEDTLQDVFERVIKYRSSYRTGTSFRTWIFAVARNAGIDERRAAGRHFDTTHVPVEELEVAEPSILHDWVERDRLAQCKAALLSLDPAHREVVDLAWKRGMKYREIATVLGISESNVKVRVHRACRQLRAQYGKMING